jgi:hypothetical protein
MVRRQGTARAGARGVHEEAQVLDGLYQRHEVLDGLYQAPVR